MEQKLTSFLRILEQAPLEPAAWSHACDALASLLSATGTLILPQQAELRSLAMPCSGSIQGAIQRYVTEGWHLNDLRTAGFPQAVARGYVTDVDLIDEAEMRGHPYYQELLAPFDLKWFVGTALAIEGATWGVAVHRSSKNGAFQASEIDLLLSVRGHMQFAAAASGALGRKRVETIQDVLGSGGRGTAVLGQSGKILAANDVAEELISSANLSVAGYLKCPDQAIDERLQRLRTRLTDARSSLGPVAVNDAAGRTLSVDLFPMPKDFAGIFSGAFALLTIHELLVTDAGRERSLQDWRLTRREAELAHHLLAGRSVERAAGAMNVSTGTARQYLKSIFKKTDTSRQAELVLKLGAKKKDVNYQ
jgi:DNA-binding CsgD family transcriptional regulator